MHINESLSMDPPYIDYPPLMPRAQWHRAKQGLLEYVNKNELVFEEKLITLIE